MSKINVNDKVRVLRVTGKFIVVETQGTRSRLKLISSTREKHIWVDNKDILVYEAYADHIPMVFRDKVLGGQQ